MHRKEYQFLRLILRNGLNSAVMQSLNQWVGQPNDPNLALLISNQKVITHAQVEWHLYCGVQLGALWSAALIIN